MPSFTMHGKIYLLIHFKILHKSYCYLQHSYVPTKKYISTLKHVIVSSNHSQHKEHFFSWSCLSIFFLPQFVTLKM